MGAIIVQKQINVAWELIAMVATSDISEEQVSIPERLEAIEGQIRVIRALLAHREEEPDGE